MRASTIDDKILFLGDVFPIGPCRLESWPHTAIIPNLECPITDASKPYPGKVVLKTDTDWLSAIFDGRIRAVCLANNHIMDYGVEGFRDTVGLLDSQGIPWFGAGYSSALVHNGIVIEIAGVRIGLMGYVCPSTSPVFATTDSAGVVPVELPAVQHDIEIARSLGAERIAVCIHWGAEEVPYPYPRDIEFARRLASIPVDLVVGHHSHCIQPFEVHRKCAIYYGLGNAIMPDLSLPSDFDRNGNPGHRYVKKQRPWNRKSLAVEYDPVAGNSTTVQVYYDGDSLQQQSRPKKKLLFHRLTMRQHGLSFRAALIWGRFRTMVFGFMERPRIPRLQHLRALFFRDARLSK